MKLSSKILSGFALMSAAMCFAGTAGQAAMYDGVFMRNSQMYEVRDGQTKPMLDDVKLGNGAEVLASGVVILRNGNRFTLHDGESITEGGIMTRDGGAESITDGYMMKDGQVYVIRDGHSFPMNAESRNMKDGSVIMRDGRVETNYGTTMQLKDGEMITRDGQVISPSAQVSQ
ncbi:MAG TPA: DUF6799 domain-containing protein [Opitutaceae bacterium]|jgi:hypothetical protein